MALTDIKVRTAKPLEKPYKLADGGGLFLLIQPAGGKWWRYKYRYEGKEKLLALGAYPDVSLADAREKPLEARKILAAGKYPGAIKKEAKRQRDAQIKNTFESVALEWHGMRSHEWTPGHAESVIDRLKRHTFAKLGTRPITDITPPELLSVFRVVEQSGALDMAQREFWFLGLRRKLH